jgi:hypothetical protein
MAKAKKQTDRRDLPFDEFVKWAPELTILADHPLIPEHIEEAFEADTFGFRYKLGPLYDILRSAETETPMAVLITGDWGTGKTSAMRWIEGLLQKWNETGPKDRIKVRPVWFYPWKYHDKEDVWRGLLAEVIANSIDIKNLTLKRLQYCGVCSVRFLLRIAALFLDSAKIKLQSPGGLLAAEIGPGALKKIITEYHKTAHPDEAYRNKFEKALNSWVRNTIGSRERMVIFIDDLDRCMPEIALQVLEALKLYLDIPNLVFVLGVDRDVVEKLVVEHYRKLGLIRAEEKDKDKSQTEEEKAKSEQDKTRRHQDEDKAKLYLSKMFQVEIELSTKEEQITKFFDESLAKMPLWKKKLSPEHQELFRGLILSLAERNPREVKRILNSAFMSGAGAEMIKVKEGKQPPGFEQGLQDFFIRRILRKPRYEWVADVIDTDEGRRFLSVWSQVACKDFAASPAQLGDVLPDYVSKKLRLEKENE